jgi:hypothetical protein
VAGRDDDVPDHPADLGNAEGYEVVLVVPAAPFPLSDLPGQQAAAYGIFETNLEAYVTEYPRYQRRATVKVEVYNDGLPDENFLITATMVMVRRALEGVCSQHGITKKPLQKAFEGMEAVGPTEGRMLE